MRGDADEAGARRAARPHRRDAPRPPCRRRRRSPARARAALVRGACARRQCRSARCPARSRAAAARHVRIRLRRNAEIVEAPHARVVRTRAEVAAELAPDERDRGVGAHRDAERLHPCRRRRPDGHVEREQRSAGAIRSRDRARRMRRQRAARGRCRRSRRRSRRRRSRPRRTCRVRPPAAWKSSQARRASPVSSPGGATREHAGRDAARARDARQHVAVAAVVARPAQHGDRARRGPERARRVGQRVPGARHQLVARDAAHLDRAPVELAHLGGGVDRAPVSVFIGSL